MITSVYPGANFLSNFEDRELLLPANIVIRYLSLLALRPSRTEPGGDGGSWQPSRSVRNKRDETKKKKEEKSRRNKTQKWEQNWKKKPGKRRERIDHVARISQPGELSPHKFGPWRMVAVTFIPDNNRERRGSERWFRAGIARGPSRAAVRDQFSVVPREPVSFLRPFVPNARAPRCIGTWLRFRHNYIRRRFLSRHRRLRDQLGPQSRVTHNSDLVR